MSDLEDRELELMEVGEGLQSTFDEASEKLDASSKLVDEELEALAERRRNCEAQVAELEAERTEPCWRCR